MIGKRAVLRCLAAALVGGLGSAAGLTVDVGGAPPAAAAPPPCVDSQPTAAAAAATARACARRVEVMSGRSATAQTFVNADGSMTVEQSVEPRWGRGADGSWTAIDVRLRAAPDGTVAPVAAALPMAFSGGGTGPLARLSQDGHDLTVSWPGTLPAPALSGDIAVYPEVLPGVDLRLTASATGFSEVLVVKTRAAAASAALRQIRFGLDAKGLTVQANDAGGADARDPAGRIVFSSPAPIMWDSSADADGDAGPTGKIAAPARRRAVMGVQVAADHLTVVPDPALLGAPDLAFPLYVDPSWTGGIAGNAWTSVWSRGDTVNSSFWQNGTALNNASTKGGAGAGRTEDCSGCGQYIIRSLFRMNLSGVSGKQITGATFRVQQQWAWTCSPASNAKLWLTGPISSSTTWNNQPGWDGSYTATTAANHKYGGGSGCAGTGDIEFNATAIVQHAVAAGWPDVTLGLRAIDEGTTNQWKRFNASTPVLAIDYNTPPNTPDSLTVDGKACVAGANRPFVATATPTLRAHVTDPDGDSMQVWYAYAAWDAAQNAFVDAGGGHQDSVANGATSQLTTGTLADGGIYTFRSQSNDGHGGTSPVTNMPGNCEWQVDLTNPVVPTVTGDVYRENSAGCPPDGCGSIGQTGRFTFASSADVASYRWGFSDPPATVITPATLGGSVSLNWTPTSGGAKTLYVMAVDRAGRTATKAYQFVVAGPTPAVARWNLDEPAGTTSLVDSTGHGHTATLAGGATSVPGRLVGGSPALHFDGTATSYANATVSEVDTSRSFSVAAWVRLGDTTAFHSVVSKDGTHSAGFRLGASPVCGCWILVFNDADTTGPTQVSVKGTAPAANVWTHLSAVYDAGAGQAYLYVNGRQAASGAVPARTWTATGALSIGRTRWNDAQSEFWSGDLAEVQVWNRSVAASEVAALSDPLAVGRVGDWHMDEVGPGPAYDASGMAHDLTFTGGAVIPPAGSGQTGTGLHLDGVAAHARTDGQVIATDQSFTVSSWVRIADGDASTPAPDFPTGNRAAVAQDGQWLSGFYLGLRSYDGVPVWRFAMVDTDNNANTGWKDAKSPALTTDVIGTWVHLVGVYDAEAGTIKLYVNGALVGTATRAGKWNATGQFTIGAARWSPAGGSPVLADPWLGDIDEVRVYAGVVTDVTRIP